MAGIGFALERLYRSNSITDRMASFAHASVIAAGPCLAAVLCIWLISAMISELEGRTTIAAFRALVIYSFALSFVVTAPIALVSARLISDKLHDRDVAAVPGIMLATFGLTTLVILLVGTPLFGVLLDLEVTAGIAAVANCAVIALVWVACLFCSVTRDYNSVTGYFAARHGGRGRDGDDRLQPAARSGDHAVVLQPRARHHAVRPARARDLDLPVRRHASHGADGGALRRVRALLADRARRPVRRDRRLDRQVGGVAVAVRHHDPEQPAARAALRQRHVRLLPGGDPGLRGLRRPPGGEVLPQLPAVLQQHPGARHAGADPRQRPAAARGDHRVAVRHHGAATADLRAGGAGGAGGDPIARHAVPAGRHACGSA